MNEAEMIKKEVDSWIKSFQRELQGYRDELSAMYELVQAYTQDAMVSYGALSRLEARVRNLELCFERILELMNKESRKKAQSCLQPLKEL